MSQVHDEVGVLPGSAVYDAMNRLLELGARLTNAMERGLDELGLTLARATLMWHVQHRGPMTQRELSQVLDVTPRNITGLVDALETSGFVVRAAHPTDRRATLVTLTDQGRKVATLRDRDYLEFATRLFGDVPEGELAGFIAAADRVLDRLREGDAGRSALAGPGGAHPAIDIVPDGSCSA
jgi:DNA-binding MarR family transcriptional regulator